MALAFTLKLIAQLNFERNCRITGEDEARSDKFIGNAFSTLLVDTLLAVIRQNYVAAIGPLAFTLKLIAQLNFERNYHIPHLLRWKVNESTSSMHTIPTHSSIRTLFLISLLRATSVASCMKIGVNELELRGQL